MSPVPRIHLTPARPRGRAGFSLIEVLVVVAVLALLTGMLTPVMGMVRNQARSAQAGKMITEVAVALEDYRANDLRHLYPTPDAARQDAVSQGYYLARDPADPASLFVQIEAQYGVGGMTAPGGYRTPVQALDGNAASPTYRCLLDPWGRPYLYWPDGAWLNPDGSTNATLMNQAADRPPGVTAAFAAQGRTMDWNPGGGEPFAYIWSYGKLTGPADAQPGNSPNWIRNRTAR
jgi:prepilin-type N-terminal cleavage/methylation domain-containing protein